MELKEEVVRVKVHDRVLKVTLDLDQGLNTQVEFAPIDDGWDDELDLQSDCRICFEEGSHLDLDWPSHLPLGVISFTTGRAHDTQDRDIWVETTPMGVVRVGVDSQFEVFWIE